MSDDTTETFDLTGRLDFMGLRNAGPTLGSVKSAVTGRLGAALDIFYDKLRSVPHTRAFFKSEAAIDSAKKRQATHWDALASGRFDQDYLRAVVSVGETHARIGLEPRWYIGGYALILEQLLAAVVEARWPKHRFGAKGVPAAQVSIEVGMVAKATLLDMELAISVYLAAAEKARRALEDEAKDTNAAVVASLGAALGALASGDFTHRIGDELPPAYRQLRDDFNGAVDRLSDAFSGVRHSAVQIGSGAEEIALASDDLSRRTEQQSANLEQTAAALDQITATVKKAADGAKGAKHAVASTKAVAEKSGEVVSRAVSAMSEIETSSQQITQIIGVIDEIAFQTNLLALNAGVEAARAGEAGRGFAVVASEVRALAQRSAEAAKEIKVLISASSTQVSGGVGLVNETGVALREIITGVSQIDGMVAEIAASAGEQSLGLAEVNLAINQMDQITQQNAAMVEQSTASAHSLKSESAELGRLIGVFRLSQAGQDTARRPSPAPIRAAPRKVVSGG